MCIFLLALLLLNKAVQYAKCERFVIIPSPNSSCPSEVTGGPCLTLQQYSSNPSRNSSITLELLAGNHRLESQLFVSNINSFAMVASAADTTTVSCGQSSYFRFDQLQHAHVHNITFVGCIMSLNYIMNATVVRSSFVNMTRCCNTILHIQQSAVQIKWCTIKKTYRNRAISINNGNVSISSSNFSGCALTHGYGAAMSISRGRVTITNSYFSNNMVIGQGYGGGAISVYDSGLGVTITNTCFNNNTAGGSGGAIFVFSGELNLVNSCFKSNKASVNDNNYGGAGGAIYISTGGMTIIGSYFSDNAAEGGHGGAFYVQSEREITIINSYFIGNRAEGPGWCGGAVFIENSIDGGGLNLFNSHFCDNRAGGSGGAIFISSGVVTATNSYFSSNIGSRGYGTAAVSVYNGGISIFDGCFSNNATSTGGGSNYIYANGGNVTVTNTTFMNSYEGRAIYYGRNSDSVSVTNNTFIRQQHNCLLCRIYEDDYFTEDASYSRAVGNITEMTTTEDSIMITTSPFETNEVIANETDTDGILTTDLEPLPEMRTTDSLTKTNTNESEKQLVTTTAVIVSSTDATTTPPTNEIVTTNAVPTTEPNESHTFIEITTVPISSTVLSITVFEAILMGIIFLLMLLIAMITPFLCISFIKKCTNKMNGIEATEADIHPWPLEMKINEAATTWGEGDSAYKVIH